MKCLFIFAICTSTLCLQAGCSPSPILTGWQEPSRLGYDIPSVRTEMESAAGDEWELSPEPTGVLTLRTALAAALIRSPELAASGYGIRVSEAEALQAGLLPNPELDLEIENFFGSGDLKLYEAAETTVAMSQLVELGGKRMKRRKAANQKTQLAGWDYELMRIDVLSKTARDFILLLASEKRLEIAKETTIVAERVHLAVSERVKAGKVSPLEQSKARVELAQARLEERQAFFQLGSARVRLSSNWGSSTPRFDSIAGDLDKVMPPPDIDSIMRRIEDSPELARWAAETAYRKAEIELALAQRIPDITIGAGLRYISEINDTAFVAGMSLPLQIFDRNQGGIRAARMEALRGKQLSRSARARVETTVAEALASLNASFVEVEAVRDDVLPSAEFSFNAAQEAFLRGKIDALNLLDAERTLFNVQRQLIDALSAYHISIIAVERILGTPIYDINNSDATGEVK